MRRTISILAIVSALGVLAADAVVATARHGGNDSRRGGDDARAEVRRAGTCTGSSTVKLKAKERDGRLETELEVDQNRSGVRWSFTVRRNGTAVASGTRVTRPPSGSFEVERRIADPAGRDTITAVATRDGETCRASLTI